MLEKRGEVTASRMLLGSLSPAMRRLVESRLRVLRAPKGRTIIGVGARSNDVYFIEEGQVQITLYSSNGREVSVRDLGAGALFGELSALDGLPRSASAIAQTDVRLLIMLRDDFLACAESCAEVGLWLARRLGGEVRRLTEKVFELSALNVQARLHCELLRMARIGGEGVVVCPAPTHAELAKRIGANREAVTREMRALVEMNVIRSRRRSLEFLDLSRLERVVGRALGELELL